MSTQELTEFAAPLPLPFAELLAALPGATLHHPPPAPLTIHAVTADSRAVTPSALFVAVQGGSADGHRYIPAALSNGACAVAGTHSPATLASLGIDLPAHIPYLQVNNARLALARAAAALYRSPSHALTVIGVTGTDGKTTTATLLESILIAATRGPDDPVGTVGVITTVAARIRGRATDTGLHVTTPDAPDVQRFLATMRDLGCTMAVVESTSHGLDQERVGAVAFDVAVVTNITHEHLDYHGTREAYVAAKAKLLRALYATPPKPGIPRGAVLNADDDGSYAALLAVLDEEEAAGTVTVVRRPYGVRADRAAAEIAIRHNELAAVATDVVTTPQATEFTLLWWGGELRLASPLIGDFNVYNITAASVAALHLGIAPAAVQVGIAEMRGVSGRMERIEAGQDFLALVDFAHSPASLERALLTLRPLVGVGPDGTPGRLIAVFGSAGLRDRAKRGLMGQVSGRLADITVITAEDPRTEDLDEINRAIEAGVLAANPRATYLIVPDRAAAIQAAVDMARPGDVVAAFGKGHERSMCFGTTEYPWSDQDALRTALEKRLRAAAA